MALVEVTERLKGRRLQEERYDKCVQTLESHVLNCHTVLENIFLPCKQYPCYSCAGREIAAYCYPVGQTPQQ